MTVTTEQATVGFGRRMRKEDARFLRGKGNYVDDFVLPGMLHAKVKHSPHARARILGIDTPEKYGRRECGAVKATESMESLAPVGSTVVLFSDPSQADKDRYQRLLRYVERKGRDVGRAQIFTGHSKVYVYRNDPVRRTANYRVAQKQAMSRSAGLWSTCWF